MPTPRLPPAASPSFSYGLEGWTFTSGTIGKASPVERLRSSDAQLRMYPGDVLAQMVPSIRGWNASLRDRICVIADAAAPSTLHVDIGAAQTLLHFFKRGRQEVCAPIAFPAASNELVLRMRLGSGNLALRDIYLFDHVQRGGLYDDEGRPQPMLSALRRANRAMVDPASHVCSTNLMQSHK